MTTTNATAAQPMTESPSHAHTHQTQTQQAPPTQQRTAKKAPAPLSVAEATKAEHAAYLAWSANPPDPDLLDAYVIARQQLRQAEAAEAASAPEPATARGGPLVLTPVIEWWTT